MATTAHPSSSSGSSFLPDASYSPIDLNLSLGELSYVFDDQAGIERVGSELENLLDNDTQHLNLSQASSSTRHNQSLRPTQSDSRLRFPAPPGHIRGSPGGESPRAGGTPTIPHAITTNMPAQPHRLRTQVSGRLNSTSTAPRDSVHSNGSNNAPATASAGYIFLNTTNQTPVTTSPPRPRIMIKPAGLKSTTSLNRSRSRGSNKADSRKPSGAEAPPPVPVLPEAQYGYDDYDDDEGEEDYHGGLDSEQAWYFTRALVAQELAWEGQELWRLKSLDVDGAEQIPQNNDDDEIDPTHLPIARYFIKHFLLTLPLIRDCPEVPSQPSLAGHAPSSAPPFWAAGLFPLLRAVHDADLSDAFDHGRRSGWERSALVRKLERFVTGGLKLSSGREHWPGMTERRGGHAETQAQLLSQSQSQGQTELRPQSQLQSQTEIRASMLSPSESQATTRAAPPSLQLSRHFTLSPPSNPNHKHGSPPISPGTQPAPARPARPVLPPRNPSRTSQPDTAAPTTTPPQPLSRSATPQPEPALAPAAPVLTRDYAAAGPPPVPPSPVRSEHSMRRSTSRGTGVQTDDGASFVSAREGITSASEREYLDRDQDEEDEDGSVYSPGSSPHPVNELHSIDGGLSPVGMRIGLGMGPREGSWYSERTEMPITPTQEAYPNQQSALGPDDDSPVVGYKVVDDHSARHYPAYAPDQTAPLSVAHRASTATLSVRKGKRAASKSPPMAAEPAVQASTSRRTPPAPTATEYDSAEDADVEGELETEEDKRGTWVAHMAIPADVYPNTEPSILEPEDRRLIYKAGAPWPVGQPVSFYRAVPFQRLSWGGFEVDIVGMRETLLSKAYVIRVRRPARLDEYVVRTEAQFAKFQKQLHAKHPTAHVRRVPRTDTKDDKLVKPTAIARSASRGSIAHDAADAANLNRSHSRASLNADASRVSVATKRSSGGSFFARSLRAQSINGDLTNLSQSSLVSRAGQRIRAYSFAGSRRSSSSTLPSRMGIQIDLKKLPTNDPRRRALRAWLRDTLSVKGVGHCKETAAFLLLEPVTPKDADVVDIMKREKIDDARRAARVAVAQGAAERARVTLQSLSAVERSCIHNEGFVEMSDALRDAPSIDQLPEAYSKAIELLTFSAAEALYDKLVAGPGSGATFRKLKQLHEAFPYFLVRQAFKFGSATMAKMLQDLLLARPFGKKSLLQKILTTVLDDDTALLLQEINGYRNKIGTLAFSEKIDIYAYASRERKEVIRQYAKDYGLELVVCICRGGESPRLAPPELQRIVRASKAHAEFVKTNPTPKQLAEVSDPDVALILNLQAYLGTVSRDRDASLLRQLLGEDDVASALECLASPFVEGLKRVYKHHGSAFVQDLQKFADQLIIIVEALRARIQDPQKSVRILNKLLARHQGALYSFVRGVHRRDTLVEEFLQWAWTASVFLRRGLAEPVDLDGLIPAVPASPRPSAHSQAASQAASHGRHGSTATNADGLDEDPARLMAEIEDLVAWHKARKGRAYQALNRRLGGDVDGDDAVTVEGDGKGKSRTEPVVEGSGRGKRVAEVEKCGGRFRDQLRHIFAV